MNILKIFKKKDNIDNGKIYTRVLYNSRYNFIELISYSSKQFYDAIELLNGNDNYIVALYQKNTLA